MLVQPNPTLKINDSNHNLHFSRNQNKYRPSFSSSQSQCRLGQRKKIRTPQLNKKTSLVISSLNLWSDELEDWFCSDKFHQLWFWLFLFYYFSPLNLTVISHVSPLSPRFDLLKKLFFYCPVHNWFSLSIPDRRGLIPVWYHRNFGIPFET